MRYLITGTAGFVGFHLARRLLRQGDEVLGIDGLAPYYDIKLKQDRHAKLLAAGSFHPHICQLEEAARLRSVVGGFRPEFNVHLAAQTGVRHSLENPRAYIESNVVGTFNVLELCRELRPRHVLIASTSSVYGANTDFPLSETARCDYPPTIYAASKKSTEVIAHCYAHLWDISTTVVRFFTAYGPWGRPDMAPSKFAANILAGSPVDIYNEGRLERDFTYIDDLVEAIVRLCERLPARGGVSTEVSDSVGLAAPFRIVNVGGGNPVGVLDFIEELERALGRTARRNYVGMQKGEMVRTQASTELLQSLTGFKPATPLSVGVDCFVRWYRDCYQV
jgi:UDP-glucuronate 4-epimerase